MSHNANDNEKSEAASPVVRPKVVVIGAGITGLSAAYEVLTLMDGQVDVVVLEAMGRVGGTVNTYDMGDLVLELGPDSFFTQKPVMLDLIKRLDLEKHLIWTSNENRRTLVAHEGKLWHLPEGFAMYGPTKLKPFLDSPLFTWSGKLRACMDIALPKRSGGGDESLSAFVRRRLGDEMLERVIQPLVAGMYTADPDLLSVKSGLPRLYDLEQKYGSVTRGLIAEAQKSGNNGSEEETEGGPRYGMFASLDGGMSILIDGLIKKLPLNTVRTQSYAMRIRPGEHEKLWDVCLFDGSILPCDAVIVATPAFRAADVIQDLSQDASEKLRSISHASSIVVNVMYYRDDIPHALDAFGFVVPRSEKRSIIACSFSSNKFPGRAPQDKVLMRVFFGGALQPEVYDFADEHLQCLLWEDLHTYLGIRVLPVFTMVTRHPQAMPQYHVGHGELIASVRKSLKDHPGVELAGNAYQGVGIPDCVLSAQTAARSVAAVLKHLPAAQAHTADPPAAATLADIPDDAEEKTPEAPKEEKAPDEENSAAPADESDAAADTASEPDGAEPPDSEPSAPEDTIYR